jgi:small subunit ribosomal protein S6
MAHETGGTIVSRLYEAMFLVDSSKASAQPEQTLDAVRAMLTRHGVQILHLDKWDDRKLAYEIEGHKRGTYYLSFFNSEGATNRDIERDCALSDLVLRVMILRADYMTAEDVQHVSKGPKPAPRSDEPEHDGGRGRDRFRRREPEREGVDAMDPDA